MQVYLQNLSRQVSDNNYRGCPALNQSLPGPIGQGSLRITLLPCYTWLRSVKKRSILAMPNKHPHVSLPYSYEKKRVRASHDGEAASLCAAKNHEIGCVIAHSNSSNSPSLEDKDLI